MAKYPLLVAFLLCFMGCQESPKPQPHLPWHSMSYAQGFSLSQLAPGLQILQIANQGDTQVILLAKSQLAIPDSLSQIPRLRIPISKLAILAAPAWGHLLRWHQGSRICAVSLAQHIYDSNLRQQTLQGQIRPLGQDLQEINLRALISSQAQVVIASAGPEANSIGPKLRKLGIPLIPYGDYLEKHPLGRAEWGKLMAALIGQDSLASAEFQQSRDQYLRLAQLGNSQSHRPSILWGSPFRGQWFIAGGRSYAARLIKDGGGNYLFAADTHTSGTPMSMEKVLIQAGSADLWLNPDWQSHQEALGTEPRFAAFAAFAHPVWRYDLKRTSDGSMAIYEEGVGRPDWQLQDLLKIMHPELHLPGEMHYYRELP